MPITILADLNITPHLSLAVRSAIDVGGWADCAALVGVSQRTPATCYVHAGPGSRIDVVLANRIIKHALCDVGLVGATGIPTHLPVAAVFQFAQYESIVTAVLRMKKIALNLKDPERERSSSLQTVLWHTHPGNAATTRAEALGAVERECRSLLAQANEAWTWHKESTNRPRTSQTDTTAEKGTCSIRTRRSTKSSDTPGCLLSVLLLKPPDEHLGQICENRVHNSNAGSLRRRRWSSQ